MKCKICKEQLIGLLKQFCSRKCYDRDSYIKNKKRRLEKNKEWKKKNPKKVKEQTKKAVNKFLENKREQFNKLMMKGYQRNKFKWTERNYVHRHRAEIIQIIGNKCVYCSKPIEQIRHKQLSKLHHVRKKSGHYDLKGYCKYLESVCKKCNIKKRKHI